MVDLRQQREHQTSLLDSGTHFLANKNGCQCPSTNAMGRPISSLPSPDTASTGGFPFPSCSMSQIPFQIKKNAAGPGPANATPDAVFFFLKKTPGAEISSHIIFC